MNIEEEFAFHNDCLSKFNNQLYSNIFTRENIISKKKALKIGEDKHYGYFLEKGDKQYFMKDGLIEHLPFKVVDSFEYDYRTDVYSIIREAKPISIPAEKRMSFRELVRVMPSFRHSEPLHFLLYKIVAMSAYIDRINARISTDAGFGKDSVVNIIRELVDSTANLYGATFAKLEYVLRNRLIVLNELGNLKKQDKINLQEFLLATGAYFNDYSKRSRKTSDTQEQYDISELSLLIFYNLPSYYQNRSQEYFDEMFTKAVNSRFIPFYFQGVLTTNFEKVIDIDKVADLNEGLYKDCIATINHFRKNNASSIDYDVPSDISFTDNEKRFERSFNVILKYISLYSDGQEEFNNLALELYECFRSYESLKSKEKKVLE